MFFFFIAFKVASLVHKIFFSFSLHPNPASVVDSPVGCFLLTAGDGSHSGVHASGHVDAWAHPSHDPASGLPPAMLAPSGGTTAAAPHGTAAVPAVRS